MLVLHLCISDRNNHLIGAEVINKLHLLSGEPEFESWVKQFLARLYLRPGQTPDYQGPLPLKTGVLAPK